MASAAAAAAKQCFIDLAKSEKSGDFDKALKAANKILRNYPKETIAFKCKLVALIHLGRFDEALTLIKKTPPLHMGECVFEKAYVQYRMNDSQAALETLAKARENDFRCMELKAQLLYRLEQFAEAYQLFKNLLKNHSDEYDDERQANMNAVISQLQSFGQPQVPCKELETFEQLYNGACHLVEAGSYKDALQLLARAEKVCRETLTEEGLTDEEMEDELAAIKTQRAFVLQQLGHHSEALPIYLSLLEMKPSDASVLATVSNNLPSARREVNLLEARKKVKSALQVDSAKLSIRQRKTLMLNQALVHLYSNQREPCRRVLDEFRKRYGPSADATVIEAGVLVRGREVQRAFTVLDAADHDGVVTDLILLTRVQIYLHEGKLEEASSILCQLPGSIRDRPAIVQLRVSLLVALNKHEEAIAVLSGLLDERKDEEGEGYCALLEQAGVLCAQVGRQSEAVMWLERALAQKPHDTRLVCRVVAAYVSIDPARAEELVARVAPEHDEHMASVDELEASVSLLYGQRSKSKREHADDEHMEIVTGKLRRHKRKRKVILPKNYDPNVPPDPERWLPKQERTAYKKKFNRRHKDREVGRGTQGAVAASPHLDGSVAQAESSPKPGSAAAAAEGPRQMRPAGQQAKKKKKKAGPGKW